MAGSAAERNRMTRQTAPVMEQGRGARHTIRRSRAPGSAATVAAIFHSRGELDARLMRCCWRLRPGRPSTILADSDEGAKAARPGHVAAEELADIGPVTRQPLLAPEDITVQYGGASWRFAASRRCRDLRGGVSGGGKNGGPLAGLPWWQPLYHRPVSPALLNIRRLVGKDAAQGAAGALAARGLVLGSGFRIA